MTALEETTIEESLKEKEMGHDMNEIDKVNIGELVKNEKMEKRLLSKRISLKI